MDFRDIVRIGLDRNLSGLKKAVDGLTPVELRWQPSPTANHISWLVWHMARGEDNMLNRHVAHAEPVWVSEGWDGRLGLPPQRSGNGDTAEDVAAFPAIPMRDLLAYFDAVRPRTLGILDGLTHESLATPLTGIGIKPPPTVATWLAALLLEQGQHLGQVAYIRGLLRGLNG